MNAPHWHVLGAGAIGCLFAYRLKRAGTDSTLILRQPQGRTDTAVTVEREAQVEQVRLPVFSSSQPSTINYLLVTTKAHEVVDAVASIASALSNDCTLLLLVNGMGLAEALRDRWPHLDIYCGTTTEGAHVLSPRHIRHAGQGETRIGRQGQGMPPDWFSQWSAATDDCYWESDINSALWSKLAVNCVINPLTALHGCPNGDLAKRPELRAEVSTLCDEVSRVSAAAGFVQTAADLHRTVASVISGTAANRSSMLQDVDKGRATEIDYITGYLLQVAGEHGIDVPCNRALLEKIKQRVP